MAVALACELNEPQWARPIGGLFSHGRTVLIATSDGIGTIQNVLPDGDIGSLLNTDAAITQR